MPVQHSGQEELQTISVSAFVLYGRATETAQLIGAIEGVLIVSGDSGIGKSALLDHLVALVDPSRMVAPPLIRVRHSVGALKFALLESLQHVVEEIIDDEGDVRTIASHLADAAKRLAGDKAREFPKVVGRFLLGVIRDRIGREAADVLTEYITDLQTSYQEDIGARLATEADSDAFNVLIGFISEVQSLADRPVVISLDGGERLSEQELGLLADLCEALPSGMGIRVGFSTPDAESQSKVDTLVLAGARELPLKPLGPDLVREWMESRGLDPTRANEVIRLTDGYPLYVQDVISLMERGEDISGIEPDNKLAILTKRSLDTLAPGIEVIARKLCGFTDPPDQKGLLDLLGLSLPEWGVIERRLSEARIFSTKVNGRAWFHELRRRYIWDSVLTAAERSEVAYATVGELLREFETERRFILLTDIASLARQSQQLMDDPEVSWTLGIDLAALAIAAALIELTESAAALPLLTTNAVLNYARSVFNASDDLLSGLHDLEDLGFMSYASQTGSLVRLPQWAAPLVPAIIAGRSATELSRVPVNGAATMIFQDALAPRLGTFATAIYGMGRPEILQLVASVRPRRSGSGADSAVYLGTHQPSIA